MGAFEKHFFQDDLLNISMESRRPGAYSVTFKIAFCIGAPSWKTCCVLSVERKKKKANEMEHKRSEWRGRADRTIKGRRELRISEELYIVGFFMWSFRPWFKATSNFFICTSCKLNLKKESVDENGPKNTSKSSIYFQFVSSVHFDRNVGTFPTNRTL